MKHTIYTKLLISYLIYGVIAFFIICTFTQHLTTDYIEKQEASNLYREASIIAGDYAAEYFGSSMSLSDFQNHMKIVADYMDAEVWVVSPDGELLMDSDDPSIGIDIQNDSSKPVVINGFDVTDFGSDNYMIGDFYGSFKHKMLSVFSPVNVSYQNIGYSHSQDNEPYHGRCKRFYEYLLLHCSAHFCSGIYSACHAEPLYLPANHTNHKDCKEICKG